MSLWVAFGAAVHTGTLWLWGYSTVTAERCHLSKQNPPCARGAQPAVTLTPEGTAQGRCGDTGRPHGAHGQLCHSLGAGEEQRQLR